MTQYQKQYECGDEFPSWSKRGTRMIMRQYLCDDKNCPICVPIKTEKMRKRREQCIRKDLKKLFRGVAMLNILYLPPDAEMAYRKYVNRKDIIDYIGLDMGQKVSIVTDDSLTIADLIRYSEKEKNKRLPTEEIPKLYSDRAGDGKKLARQSKKTELALGRKVKHGECKVYKCRWYGGPSMLRDSSVKRTYSALSIVLFDDNLVKKIVRETDPVEIVKLMERASHDRAMAQVELMASLGYNAEVYQFKTFEGTVYGAQNDYGGIEAAIYRMTEERDKTVEWCVNEFVEAVANYKRSLFSRLSA